MGSQTYPWGAMVRMDKAHTDGGQSELQKMLVSRGMESWGKQNLVSDLLSSYNGHHTVGLGGYAQCQASTANHSAKGQAKARERSGDAD